MIFASCSRSIEATWLFIFFPFTVVLFTRVNPKSSLGYYLDFDYLHYNNWQENELQWD